MASNDPQASPHHVSPADPVQAADTEPTPSSSTPKVCRLGTFAGEDSRDQAFVRAVLDLRQWESRQVAERVRHLVCDRDHSRAETHSLRRQLGFLEEWIMNLYMSCRSSSSNDTTLIELVQHLIYSTSRLRERLGQDEQAYHSLRQSLNLYGPHAELMLLRQQLQAQSTENDRLKARINTQVQKKMDEAFNSALQEALKQERAKDEFIINDLRQENHRLRLALESKQPTTL